MRGAFVTFTALTMLLAGGRAGAQSDGDAAAYFVTDDGATGLRPILGGGIGVVAANGFGVSAGVQKVFIEGGEAVLGITLTLGGR